MPGDTELKSQLKLAREEVATVRTKLHNAIRKGKGLEERLAEKTVLVSQLEMALEEQRRRSESELGAVRAALTAAQARCTELEGAGAARDAQVEADAAPASVWRRGAAVADLEAEIALIRAETDAEKLQLAQAAAALREELAQLQRSHEAALLARDADLAAEKACAAEQARGEVQAMADELERSEAARAATSAEARRLEAQLAGATAELARVNRAAEALQDELTHTTERLSQELARARAKAMPQHSAPGPMDATTPEARGASVQTHGIDAADAGLQRLDGAPGEGEERLQRQLAVLVARLDEQFSRLRSSTERETKMLWDEIASATAVAVRAKQGEVRGGRLDAAVCVEREHGEPGTADGEHGAAGAGQTADADPSSPGAGGDAHSEGGDAVSWQEKVEVFRKKAVAALKRAKASAAESEELKHKLAAAEAEDASLRQLIDRLQGDAAARQEALTLLTIKLAETEKELGTALADAQTASSQTITSQQSQIVDLSKQLEVAEARAAAAEEELATATSALRAAATRVTGLEAECDEMEAKLHAAERDVSDLRADYAASQRQLESAEAVASKAVSMEEALKLEVAQLRRQNAELTGRLEHADDLQANCDLLSSKLQVAKEQIATLEEAGSELRQQLADALRKLSQAEQTRAKEPEISDAVDEDATDREAELEARRAELEGELEQLQVQRKEAEELREDLAAKLAAAEAKSAEASMQAAALQEQQAALKRDAQQRLTVFNALQSSFALKEDAWRAQVQEAEQTAAATLQENARLVDELAEALEKCSALDEELQQVRADAQDAAAEHARVLDALQQAHSLAEQTVATQAQALQDAQRQAREARAAAEVAEGLPERVLLLEAALETALADAQGARASLAREDARGKQAHSRIEGLLLQLALCEKRVALLDQQGSADGSHIITISSGAPAANERAVESAPSTSGVAKDGGVLNGCDIEERLREAERRLVATEARLAAQAAAEESLERDNKQLRWQVAMSSGQAVSGHHAPSERSTAAAPVEERLRALSASASTAGRLGAVLAFVLKHRRWLGIGYIALLHWIVYVALTHGMLTRQCTEAPRPTATGRPLLTVL